MTAAHARIALLCFIILAFGIVVYNPDAPRAAGEIIGATWDMVWH